MRPITYALQFRGQANDVEGRLRKLGRAPGCALVTSLTKEGLVARYVWARDDGEALFESTVAFTGAERFDELGTIHFGRGHALHLRGFGELAACPDPHLRHGTVVWRVTGGVGRFEGARGRVTSNFFLSDTGDLTESQLGVIFVNGTGHAFRGPRDADQGSPRRERRPDRETIETPPGTQGIDSEGDMT